MNKIFILLFSLLPFMSFAGVTSQGAVAVETEITQEVPTQSLDVEKENTENAKVKAVPTSFSFMSLARGIFGLIILLLILYILSSNRGAISWKLVAVGISMQIIIALSIQYIPLVETAFTAVSDLFVAVLDYTRAGSEFLFGGFMNVETYGFIFAFQVLPTIVFFSALTSVLFYLGIIQRVVAGMAIVMTKFMGISGAESLSVAGNIFLGQTESPLMIKAYLDKMNKSEILLVMIGGMATLAGGVLAAYIAFLGGDDPELRAHFAKHLLMASIMAAPGAVVASKMLVPQTEKVDNSVEVTDDKIGSNFLDAMSKGTSEGLKLAANVAAMLLVFVAFIAMFNSIVSNVAGWFGLNEWLAEATSGKYTEFNLQYILGVIFSPLMYIIGVPLEDISATGRLLGEKIIMSEFVGYVSLGELKEAGVFVYEKSIVISTFMLAGFANFASIGIQIGGIGSLSPAKREQLSKYGIKALIGGTIASLISATIAGVIIS